MFTEQSIINDFIGIFLTFMGITFLLVGAQLAKPLKEEERIERPKRNRTNRWKM